MAEVSHNKDAVSGLAVNDNTPYSLLQITSYFLKLGTLGFGGPVALVNYMHHDLVEQRK